MPPFRLGKDRPRREKERKGVGASWTPPVPAGDLAAVLSPAAPAGGAASPWSSLIAAVSRATGLSPAASSTAGIAGLVLGASTLVAGVSYYIGNPTPTGAPARALFSAAAEGPALEPSPSAGELAGPSAPSSLEFLSGNAGQDGSLNSLPPEAALLEDALPARPGETPGVQPPVAARAPKPAGPKQALAMAKSLLAKASPQSTRAALKPVGSLSGSVGGGFQEIYRPNGEAGGLRTQKRPRLGPNRRTAVLSSGPDAVAQARFADRLSRQGAGMASGQGAAFKASLPFDGSNSLGASLPAEGMVLGASGMGANASGALDAKDINIPPPDIKDEETKNETPYQGLLYAAMGALALGTMLLTMAGQLIGQAQKNPGPQSAQLIQMGQALAAAAMGAGGAAAGLGAAISGQENGQVTQGIPFIVGGAVLMAQAALVIATAEQAGENASQGIGSAAQMAQGLSQMAMQNNGDQVDENLDRNQERQQERRDVNVNYSPGSGTGPFQSGDLPPM